MLSYDGETVYSDFTSYGSTGDKRLQMWFGMAVKDIREFFVPEMSVAATSGIRTLTLADSNGRKMYEPVADGVYLNGLLTKVPISKINEFRQQFVGSTDVPRYWSQVRDYEIMFDTAYGSSATYKLRGWADHDVISANNTVINLGDEKIDLVATYMAAQVAEKSVSDAVGMGRLQIYNQKAYEQVKMWRARHIKRYAGASTY